PDAVRASAKLGAHAIELHTGEYANAAAQDRDEQLGRLRRAAALAHSLGLAVHAGHGPTPLNVPSVASIPLVEELNIGHSIVAHALFVGLERSVREMKEIIRIAREH